MEGLDKVNLRQRTLDRNASTWITMDWGGLLQPLTPQQEVLDSLGRGYVETFLAIGEETWEIKEIQRDRTDEVEQGEITQGRQLVEDKVALGREQLAIKIAIDEYVLAVRVYDAKVRGLIMGAKEYAAQVEREQLAVETSRAQLAVSKEELHLKEINARIYYEVIQRAQVEADLARAQVDVAKAHVRALMADIEAGRAEIELVEAEVQKYVAMAEKATLQADVATIYAEILTKHLSEIKLDVGRQEIEAGFGYIQSKLDDMLAIWDTRTLTEAIKTETEEELEQETELLLTAQKREEDIKDEEADLAREVFDYEVAATDNNLEDDKELRAILVAAKLALHDARTAYAMQQLTKRTWAEQLANTARKYVYKGQVRLIASTEKKTLTISK